MVISTEYLQKKKYVDPTFSTAGCGSLPLQTQSLTYVAGLKVFLNPFARNDAKVNIKSKCLQENICVFFSHLSKQPIHKICANVIAQLYVVTTVCIGIHYIFADKIMVTAYIFLAFVSK